MICPYCGSETDDNSQFCGECGADLRKAAQMPQGSPAPEPPAQREETDPRMLQFRREETDPRMLQFRREETAAPQPAAPLYQPEPQPQYIQQEIPQPQYIQQEVPQPQFIQQAPQQYVQQAAVPVYQQPAPQQYAEQPVQPQYMQQPQPQPVPAQIQQPAPQQIPQPQPIQPSAPQPQMPQRQLEAPAFEAAATALYSGKRSLYLFEIASYIIIGIWVLLFIIENSRGYRRSRVRLEDFFQYIILASGLIPALLSLIPPSADAKGKPSPVAARVLLALLIPLTAIGVLCIVGVLIEPINPNVNICLVIFGLSMVFLLIQDIRRIRRS